jgi:RNA polymerase sigma-70 factor (ECF subfamily)
MDADEQALTESKQPSDHSLLNRYRGGSQDAATELYLRYAQRLRGLARTQLSANLAARVDIDDIVQSIFGSFFRGVNSELYQVPAGEELWKLLLVIALHKIRTQGRYHNAAKRDARRTTSTESIEPVLASRAEADQAFLQLVIEETLESMPDQHRKIVEMRLEGLDVMEIAEKLGRSKRTVERLLQQARARLSVLLDEGK